MAAIRIRKVIESDRLPELRDFVGQELQITLEPTEAMPIATFRDHLAAEHSAPVVGVRWRSVELDLTETPKLARFDEVLRDFTIRLGNRILYSGRAFLSAAPSIEHAPVTLLDAWTDNEFASRFEDEKRQHEAQWQATSKLLQGSILRDDDPFGPAVPPEDWEALA